MRHARIGALALVAAIAAIWISRAETAPAPNVAVWFAPNGDDHRIHKALEDLLRSAKKEVVIAMYQFTSHELRKTVSQVGNKVKVRVLLDEEQTHGSYSQDDKIQGKQVEVRVVRLPGKGAEAVRFHHKFCVVDGETVATGSFNWTIQADEKNYENLLVLRDPEIAAKYLEAFEGVWNDEKVTKKK